jgi:hypothetical protein
MHRMVPVRPHGRETSLVTNEERRRAVTEAFIDLGEPEAVCANLPQLIVCSLFHSGILTQLIERRFSSAALKADGYLN